jgi:hypothetical protein
MGSAERVVVMGLGEYSVGRGLEAGLNDGHQPAHLDSKGI